MTASRVAVAKLQRQLELVPRLRGRGPLSYHYGQWVDATHHLLVTIFGEESPEARGFLELVGVGARDRGWGVPMAPHHPLGLRARLERAETYLRELVSRLQGP